MTEDPSCPCGTRDPSKSHCALCHENTDSLNDMIHHLRQYHPDQYEEPWRWPDGGLVIEDDYPDMEDFLTPQRIQVLAQDVAWTCPGCLQTESYTVLWYTLQPVSLRCPHCKTESAPIQPPEL